MHSAHTWQGIDLHWAYGSLLQTIARRMRCNHRAKDALHDAFIRFAVTPKLLDVAEPHAYFNKVVQSVLIDHHREARRTPLLGDLHAIDTDMRGDDEGHALSLGLYHPSAEEVFAVQQRLEVLQRLVDALPPKCREVFWLFRIEGLSQAEIAGRLGVSINMVERHTMRALLDLRAARELLSP